MKVFDYFLRYTKLDKAAVICDDVPISYSELFLKIKSRVKELSLEQNCCEGRLVLVQRSLKLNAIIDIMACLSQNYAFINIPSNFPDKRIEQICNISKPYAYISDSSYKIYNNYRSYARDLAYMIFTSGTTGEPKGVMVSDNNLVEFLNALQNICPCNENTTMLQFASFSFDASIWEIFATLCFGGTLVLTPHNKTLFFADLSEFIKHNQVNRALLTPIVARTLVVHDVPSLKDLFVGGDVFHKDILENWSGHYNLWNAYGPTEATICVALHKFRKNDQITIGKAFGKVDLSIQNGELVIKGDQVAIGHVTSKGMSLYNKKYCTGDLVSQNANGDIIFNGRVDDQIKIRGGYRISLQEIQKTIENIPNAGSVLVITIDGDGEKEMVCFFDGCSSPRDLEKAIAQVLPQYMVPSKLIHLDTWPLNNSGKIDRNALKKLIAPIQMPEKATTINVDRIVRIWEEVLSSKICEKSNFFELGGQSFQALQVIQRYAMELGVTMELIDFFQCPVLEDQMILLNKKEKAI